MLIDTHVEYRQYKKGLQVVLGFIAFFLSLEIQESIKILPLPWAQLTSVHIWMIVEVYISFLQIWDCKNRRRVRFFRFLTKIPSVTLEIQRWQRQLLR